MANLRKPVPLERHGPDCTDQGNRRKADHAHAAGISALGSSFQDFYAGRFRLTLWLLDRHSRSGAQRTRTAWMLVLGNILLVGLILLLALLAMIILQSTALGVILTCLSLTLISVLLSTLLALLSVGGLHQAGNGPDPAEPGVFFHSGEGDLTSPGFLHSEDQFRQGFYQATRKEMLDGAIAELYTQARRRVRQERFFRRARIAYALALFLFVLTVLGLFLALIW
jgi:hypothetical protein